MLPTVRVMTLQDVLQEHGIYTIKDFRMKTGLSKQHAWRLWHGKDRIGLRLANRIAKTANIPLAKLIAVKEAVPPEDAPSHP